MKSRGEFGTPPEPFLLQIPRPNRVLMNPAVSHLRREKYFTEIASDLQEQVTHGSDNVH